MDAKRTSLARTAAAVLILLACSKKHPVDPNPFHTHNLVVTVETGIEGWPAAGRYACPDGDTTEYGYRTTEDYSNLVVILDGEGVPAEGWFIMDRDRVLSASCGRRVLWRFRTDQAVYYASPAVADDGTIYFGTGMYRNTDGWTPGGLVALNPDGSLKWSQPLGNATYGPSVGNDGTVFVMDRTYAVHAFSPDGAPLWTFDDFEEPFFVKRDMGQRTPAIGSDGTVYAGADGLYALDPATGRPMWHLSRTHFGRECIASPVVGPDGTVFVVIGEDTLYAVRPDGSRRWAFGFANEDELTMDTPAIGADGTLYIATEKGLEGSFLYAVRPDGSLKWRIRTEGGRIVRASPAIGPDGTIYLATKAGGGDSKGRLLAYSPSGVLMWEYGLERLHTTPDDSYSSPSVGADGVIYFGAETGMLYAVNPDGTLNWKHMLFGINWSSPVILDDGTLLIGGIDNGPGYTGVLCAVITTSMGYAAGSPWPRFMHDNRNTGRFGGR
ncbi:MAG: PQQ-binding-like beta-propeller repeat protein [bacterium]|nr:PQQ-binding-like beta-propeller repeat protein [bacterium]